MKRCPHGVIVSPAELAVLSGAVDLAIELVRSDIRSNTRPNPKFHDADYKTWSKAIKESLRQYQECARKLRKVAVKKQ